MTDKQKVSEASKIVALEKFVEIQEREISLKEKELEFKTQELTLREKEIESNKEIALRSIAANEVDRGRQAAYFGTSDTKRLIFKVVVTLTVLTVVIVSMYTGNAQYAIELAKIGGGVIMGYLAGIYKGKADQLEQESK